MDKISGIIPNSQRVSSVDLKNSQPVRPGTPTFGRPEGVSTSRERRSTTAEAALNQHKNLMNSRSHREAKIVSDLADGFFMHKRTEAPKGPVRDFDFNYNLDRDVASMPVNAAPDVRVPRTTSGPEIGQNFTEAAEQAVEKEYVPPGSYLDVSA